MGVVYMHSDMPIQVI